MQNTMKITLAAALLFAGCTSELDGKPTAKVAEAKKPDPATDAKADTKVVAAPDAKAGAAKTLKVDPAVSKIGFVGRKVTGDHTGDFKTFTGEATVAGKEPKSVAFTVETASVTTDADDLTNHLKAPDFFDVEKFPKATFTSTSITPVAPGTGGTTKATHDVTGDLELHGVKKSITFPATITVDDRGAKGTAEFKISRKDFAIVYPGKPNDLISDEVLLKLDLAFAG